MFERGRPREAEQMVNGRPVEEPHSTEFKQAAEIYDHLRSKGLESWRAEVNLRGT